jgi:sterol desaturase/sphingolipid hydroxylase (fatty acid hydroxylase superfamily)
MLVFANAFEWRIHRSALHKRWRVMPALYDRHTPVHHRVYIHDDMELRAWRELSLILIPPWAGVPLFVALLPVAWLLAAIFSMNVALMFMATSMFYVVTYELLHMSYHLPRTSRVGRNRVIRALARHHSIHHDPRLMQRWNMNVTVPLWDIVRRTRRTTTDVASASGRADASTHASTASTASTHASTPAHEPVIQ